ncbi:hypothetical protein I3760_14G025600 [Carya illinoinensis]|nr:hypothetical protein I3760_14G025600 [Carya illinoinensis]
MEQEQEQALVYTPTHRADDSIKEEEQFERNELSIDIPPEPKEPRGWPDELCIYRVPKRLREVRKRAYTPQLVSIGPFHRYMRKESKDMENQKLIYFLDFCNRTGKNNKDLALIIQRNEDRIRRCYSEDFRLSSKEFVQMIILDAVFILELFYRKFILENEKLKAKKDYILSRPCIERSIQHDLLLLENQVPFFLLEELYQNGEPSTKKPTLRKLSCGFFGDLYHSWKPESKKSCFTDWVECFFCLTKTEEPKNDEVLKHITDLDSRFDLAWSQSSLNSIEVKHFTDLVRCFFRPLNRKQEGPKPNKSKRIKPLYTATKIDEAGLKFTTPDSERDLLQIQFREKNCACLIKCCPGLNLSWLLSCLPCLKRTCLVHMQCFLEIPPLRVDDKTECLFRNLMALEQCHYPYETYICDYIVLLDDLITTKADVRLLVEKKIIVNELGSSAAVTKLVNNLAQEIEESGNHDYGKLCEKLNDYCERDWNRLVGTLTRVYFTDFFKGTATVVGIIVLVLTLWNFQRLFRLSASKY